MQMPHEHVIGNKKNSVYTLTINRPDKRNALTFEMLAAIAAEVEKTILDPEVRAVVIKGEGKVFSAGVDFNSLGRLAADVSALGGRIGPFLRAEIHKGQQWLNRLEAIEIPIICAMHGGVFGMAVELALACDIRLMSADCTWGLPEAQFGLIADLGGTVRLAKTIGAARAMEVLMTGGRYPAGQALEWQLVNHVYPTREELYAAAGGLAAAIARMAPLAVGAFKKIIKRGEGVDLMTQLDMEAVHQSVMIESADFKEGLTAQFEKRTPVWKAK
jgi:enoyl-CoA hydratase/carnithine racemase